jgi:hypothetical protein
MKLLTQSFLNRLGYEMRRVTPPEPPEHPN